MKSHTSGEVQSRVVAEAGRSASLVAHHVFSR